MLISLTIRHYTIVDELNIEFEPGMTAFTGETGAGKSIMLDALLLILGQRAEPSVIRDGFEQCELIAGFQLDDNVDALQWLLDQSIETNDGEVILRRVIQSKGRSKAFINGSPYPLQKLKEFGDTLVNIHGQNEQYHLLKHEVHRSQLDAFALNDNQLSKVQKKYQKVTAIGKDIELLRTQHGHAEQIALIEYQVEELNSMAMAEGEYDALVEEHNFLSSANILIDKVGAACQTIYENESHCVLSELVNVQNMLSEIELSHENLNASKELIGNAVIQLEEAQGELANFQSQLEQDPERLQWLDKRLEQYHDIARKHKIKPSELFQLHQQLSEQLNNFKGHESKLTELEEQLSIAAKQYWQAATELRGARVKEAGALGCAITEMIQTLGMPNGTVEVAVIPEEKMSAHGSDHVEYRVALNPGSKPRPLAKIASGGELSRISLAIQVLTAEKKAYPTLMFDEVDSGIGGATAARVGQLLQRLGKHTQVFCVTHQAQVAANANWHYLVKKHTKDNQTFSEVILLISEQKIEELARMLSGVTMTDQTLAHAKTLLEQGCTLEVTDN